VIFPGERSEYRFDYREAKPNRFATQAVEEPLVIVLEPDEARVFQSADTVNRVLRALIKTMPLPPGEKKIRPRRTGKARLTHAG
jgi:hypothetical protein